MNYYNDITAAFLFPKFMGSRLDHVAHMDRFYRDTAAGTLPGVSFVDPGYTTGESEENPADIRLGERFAAKVVHAVTQAMFGPLRPSMIDRLPDAMLMIELGTKNGEMRR